MNHSLWDTEISLWPTSPWEKQNSAISSASVSVIRMSGRLSQQKWGGLQALSGAVRDDPWGNEAKIMITAPHDWFHVNNIHKLVCSLTLSNTHTHTTMHSRQVWQTAAECQGKAISFSFQHSEGWNYSLCPSGPAKKRTHSSTSHWESETVWVRNRQTDRQSITLHTNSTCTRAACARLWGALK